MVQDINIFGNLYAHYICLDFWGNAICQNVWHCEHVGITVNYVTGLYSLRVKRLPSRKDEYQRHFFSSKSLKLCFGSSGDSLYYSETSDAYFPFLNRLLSCPSMLYLCKALKKAVVISRCSDQPSLSLAVVNGINSVGILASILSAVSHLHASFHKFFSYLRFPEICTITNSWRLRRKRRV